MAKKRGENWAKIGVWTNFLATWRFATLGPMIREEKLETHKGRELPSRTVVSLPSLILFDITLDSRFWEDSSTAALDSCHKIITTTEQNTKFYWCSAWTKLLMDNVRSRRTENKHRYSAVFSPLAGVVQQTNAL
eukprot:3653137-Amphidinium_carterae.1